MEPHVIAVAASPRHRFSKPPALQITLIAGLGVLDDAHAGATVKHRSRVARDPAAPNLRQVHLIHAELLEELARKGFSVAPGDLGDNITTRGIDLVGLAENSLLRIGPSAVVRITGLRNPCSQIDKFQRGLMAATLGCDASGDIVRKAGVMGVIVAGGEVMPGDMIVAERPFGTPRPLQVV